MSADFLSRLFHHVRTEAGTLRIAVYKTWQAIIWISSGDWLPKKKQGGGRRIQLLGHKKTSIAKQINWTLYYYYQACPALPRIIILNMPKKVLNSDIFYGSD